MDCPVEWAARGAAGAVPEQSTQGDELLGLTPPVLEGDTPSVLADGTLPAFAGDTPPVFVPGSEEVVNREELLVASDFEIAEFTRAPQPDLR